MAAVLFGIRAASYAAGWTTGALLAAATRLLPVAPVPDLDPCPCICCAARAALLATNRTETPWCDCADYPPHQRCACTACRQVHHPVELVSP